jgi:hypothetical protein
MHFLASVVTGVAIGAGSFLGLYHDGAHGSSTPPGAPSTFHIIEGRVGSSTRSGGDRPPFHNQQGSLATSTIICVGSAVATRETSIDSAEATFTTALNSAYTARASALASAYAQTTGSDVVRAAVKVAWKAFSSSTQSARASWSSARQAAWQTFATAAKACGASPTVLDTNDSSLETSGE